MQALSEPSGKQRIESIDILRGAIMLIMAIDHSRDMFHYAGALGDPENLATTTPFFFFTRWITHFCAPTFVFLSGISAYLAGTRRTVQGLSAFLIKRGLWLVLVEVVLITFAITFNPFYNAIILQVIWATGLSMVILGLLVRAPLAVIGIIGGLIFIGHDLLDFMPDPKNQAAGVLLKLFLTARGTIIPLGNGHFIFDLYAVLPWTGIMLLGYVTGTMYGRSFDPQRRRKILLLTGSVVLLIFIVLRFINKYGDPQPWSVQKNSVYTVISFLRVSKYPPSLLYSCMTLGISLVVLSLIEKAKNKFASILMVYGNVPFFYYVLHFYLLHTLCAVLFFATGYKTSQIIDPNSFFFFRPVSFGFSLGVVYLLWFCVVSALYLPCRWFGRYKKTHSQWWLSYL